MKVIICSDHRLSASIVLVFWPFSPRCYLSLAPDFLIRDIIGCVQTMYDGHCPRRNCQRDMPRPCPIPLFLCKHGIVYARSGTVRCRDLSHPLFGLLIFYAFPSPCLLNACVPWRMKRLSSRSIRMTLASNNMAWYRSDKASHTESPPSFMYEFFRCPACTILISQVDPYLID